MIAIIFFLFVLIALIYILSPLVGETHWPFLSKGKLTEIRSARKEGIWAISDVDSEYEMGKLTKDDHALLRNYLKGEVVPVIRAEKDLLGPLLKPVKGISEGLREDLMREVVRICGKKFSA
jgi:hypothetical protein